ncbi:MAG TPA: SgcJ/EcaC family oxidoreductase [Thermoanaerobaculia bacterium]|nr:SgcJ/EcaC family oxidoreductase [Thermoanaerobaculia bacterium]
MKKLFLTLFLFLTAAGGFAIEEPNHAVHQALRQLKTTMSKALNEGDVDTIVANVTPDIVFTTMNGDVCRGREQIRAYFEKMMRAPGHIVKSVNTSFEADALTILYGDDTGIAYGSSKDHYDLTNGQKFDIDGRWSCTLVRQGDRWLIASFHYSTNVFNNPIDRGIKHFLMAAGIVAAVVSLIVGLLLGMFIRRKRTA